MNATTSRGTEWYFEKRASCLDIGAFFMDLGVSKSRFRLIYASQGLQFFADGSRSLGFVVFVCPFGFQKSIFSELIGI